MLPPDALHEMALQSMNNCITSNVTFAFNAFFCYRCLNVTLKMVEYTEC